MKIINKNLNLFLIIVIVLLIVKTDFRLSSTIYCCGDDYDYFKHAETIALDFDFDYTNQLNENNHIKYNGKIAPKGFVGTGLLASPFFFVGHHINNFVGNSDIFNLQLITYSFSSIFYLFIGSLFLFKALNLMKQEVNKLLFTILFFGSGISYFAFERFSMTHVYEVFINCLIIYLVAKYSFEKRLKIQNIISFVIPIVVLIGLLTRWTNYYLLILPFLIFSLINNKWNQRPFIKNIYFWIGSIIAILTFCIFSYNIYGLVTFNPQYVYGSNRLSGFFTINQEFFISNFKNALLILFGQEFGLLWTSTCIFLGFVISLFNTFRGKQKFIYFFLTLSYLQVISTVLVWKTVASSYGIRYVFSLIPISIFLLFINKNFLKDNRLVNVYFGFGVFGLLSVLFFESTAATQLSTIPITNSFGTEEVRYSNPDYVSGMFKSLFNIEAYQSVIARSFLAALVLKLLMIIFNKTQLIEFFSDFGLPVDNADFLELLNNVEIVKTVNFIYFFLLLFFITLYLFKKLSSNINN